MTNNSAPLLQMQNIKKDFFGNQVLTDINFTLEAGEVLGDYASGPNHTLPTMGAARYTGGLWVGTFLKVCTFQRYRRDAMGQVAPLAARMARGEGLAAHAAAAEVRLEVL